MYIDYTFGPQAFRAVHREGAVDRRKAIAVLYVPRLCARSQKKPHGPMGRRACLIDGWVECLTCPCPHRPTALMITGRSGRCFPGWPAARTSRGACVFECITVVCMGGRKAGTTEIGIYV